jgi:hypothetical protein
MPTVMPSGLRPLIVKQLKYGLTPVAGLPFVGANLKAVQPVFLPLDAALPIMGGVTNSHILRSYLGLRVQGKSDFDAIENFRGNAFCKQALCIGLLPSSPTLRQRMDARAGVFVRLHGAMIVRLLGSQRPDYGVLHCARGCSARPARPLQPAAPYPDGPALDRAGAEGAAPGAAGLGLRFRAPDAGDRDLHPAQARSCGLAEVPFPFTDRSGTKKRPAHQRIGSQTGYQD